MKNFGVDHSAGDGGSDASLAEGGAVDAGADAGEVPLVQQITARGSDTRSLAVTLSGAPANGHTLILAVAVNGPTSMSASDATAVAAHVSEWRGLARSASIRS